MRVAFVTVGETGRPTGGYRYDARVISGLQAEGIEVEEIVPCGASYREQEAHGGDPLPEYRLYDAVVVDALARVVVSPHLEGWRARLPVVSMVHELQSVAGPTEDAAREAAHEAPLLRADRVVAVSAHGAGLLARRGVSPGRIRVVPPGCDGLPRVHARKDPGAPVRVVCVAQWIPRKGILALVRAWKGARTGEALLELFGETDADAAYAGAVRGAVGDDGSVVVRGVVPDGELAAGYAAADAFALPSRYEGYGVVYAEALRFGLPVIACGVGPVPEVLGSGTSLLVPPGDERALSGALERLIRDAPLRSRLSAAARDRAAGLPLWTDTVAGFRAVLDEALRARVAG